MRLNKKVVESAIVFAFAGVLTITSVTGRENTVIAKTSLEENGIAGVTAELFEYQKRVAEELLVGESVRVKSVETDLVAASAEGTTQNDTEDVTQEKNEETTEVVVVEEKSETEKKEDKIKAEWADKLMANVDEFLNVREAASEDSKIIGKMYKGDRAVIKEKSDTWTKIESGSVTGYVKNEYCVMGEEALKYAKKNCDEIATVTIDGLRVRDEQSTDSSVITVLTTGDKLKIKKNAETKDGWIAVEYNSNTRYISDEFVTVSYNTGKAITIEEELAAIAAAEEAKRAKEASNSNAGGSSQSNGAKKTQGSSVAANTDDVTLLAALIQCEAGGCSYDCQLAVGSVVVNRMKSGSYPNSLYKVIYQRGQFGPASSGKLARRLRSGVSSTARKAAQAALSGVDNTNGAKSFKLASSGHKGVKYGPVVFY